MVGWHHRCNGHEFEQTPKDSEEQGSLVCCIPGVAKSWTRLSGRTTRNERIYPMSILVQTSAWVYFMYSTDHLTCKLMPNHVQCTGIEGPQTCGKVEVESDGGRRGWGGSTFSISASFLRSHPAPHLPPPLHSGCHANLP